MVEASEIYRKSERGLDELAIPHGHALSARERQMLILMDGQRTVADLSELVGPETAWVVAEGLVEMGFAERAGAPAGESGPPPVPRRRHSRTPRYPTRPRLAPQRRWTRDWFVLINLAMLAVVLVMAACLVALSWRLPGS